MHGLRGIPTRRFAALGSALAVLALGCDSLTQVSGRVVDAAGRPVAGALVSMRLEGVPPDSAEWFSRADSAGRFEAASHGGLGTPDPILAVCAEGRGRVERRIPEGAWLRNLTVTVPAPTVGSPQARCAAPPGASVLR